MVVYSKFFVVESPNSIWTQWKTVKKTEARTSRFFVGAGNTIALLIDEGLFHLLAGEGVGLVTAEDEDLTVIRIWYYIAVKN